MTIDPSEVKLGKFDFDTEWLGDKVKESTADHIKKEKKIAASAPAGEGAGSADVPAASSIGPAGIHDVFPDDALEIDQVLIEANQGIEDDSGKKKA